MKTLVSENEITPSDVAPSQQSTSVFEKLLMNPVYLETWNNFLQKSEERQLALLAPNAKSTKQSAAETPMQRYKRIDRSTRRLLRKANISTLFLEQLESDVRSYFDSDAAARSADKDSVEALVWTLLDSFSRNLAHAVCQYYGLLSYSTRRPSCCPYC